MFVIPEAFANFMVVLSGDEGRKWVERLPDLLTSYEERWHLKIGAPFPNLSYNYVAPAVRADGTAAVLKVGLTDEFPSQPLALQIYDGHGMVRLLEFEERDSIMLMESLRPGTTLRQVEDDERTTLIAAQVMRAMWRPVPPELAHLFPTVEDWGRDFTRVRQRFDGGTGPFPAALFKEAERLYAELNASQTAPVLLHGDLHHDNILAAEREPWLAIDPKGVIGEPAYETGSWLRNFWPDILSVSDPRRLMSRRIDLFAEALGFERTRILDWAFAQSVLSCVWSVDDKGELEKEGLFFCEVLDTIRR